MQSTFTRLAIALIVTLIIPITLFGQTENDALPRRAFFGVVLGSNDSGAIIATSTVEGSTAASAGIRAGDVLETIEDTAIRKPADVIAALGKKSAGSEINIHLSRAGAPQSLSAVLKSFPAERMEHAKVEYGSVAVEGHRLR